MALLILALLQRIFLMSSLMLLLVWLIFFMVLIKLLRSEERFSRNAETDLVCRLLLEKKKKYSQNLAPQTLICELMRRLKELTGAGCLSRSWLLERTGQTLRSVGTSNKCWW